MVTTQYVIPAIILVKIGVGLRRNHRHRRIPLGSFGWRDRHRFNEGLFLSTDIFVVDLFIGSRQGHNPLIMLDLAKLIWQ